MIQLGVCIQHTSAGCIQKLVGQVKALAELLDLQAAPAAFLMECHFSLNEWQADTL